MKSRSIHRNPHFEKVNEDPEKEANKVLLQVSWDESVPVDLIEICDMSDIEVKFLSKPEMKEHGKTKFMDNGDFYIVINTYGTDCLDGFSSNKTKSNRQRFTLAHEIGHCILESHRDINLQQNLENPANPHSNEYKRYREEQANLFAAHLLIPRKSFKKLSNKVGWNNPHKLIQKVSQDFSVSMQVAVQQMTRLADFSCIAILFDESGLPIRTPTYSSDFSETGLFYGKNQLLPEGTIAYQVLKNSIPGGSKKYRDASIWFPEQEWKADKYSVIENSIKAGKYGVISFLEIEEINIR